MSHCNTITHCNSREYYRHTACLSNSYFNCIDNLINIHMTWYNLIIRAYNTNHRFLHLFCCEAKCIKKASCRCLLHTNEPGEAELRAGNRAMAEERWDDAMHYYQLSAEEGCAEGLAMMGEMLYEGRGCRKSPAQARKFWKKAADAGDVAAWVALGDDAMVQGKGAGAALRAYRKAQKLCASTPDIAYMPQVCLRVAQYETQYISRKKALAQLAEAKQGFLVRKKEGDETAQSWLDETEAVIRQLLERE